MICIQATNGRFYINPVLADETCNITFDIDDGCVVLCKFDKPISDKTVRSKIHKSLKSLGIDGKLGVPLGLGTFIFTPKDEMSKCYMYSLHLKQATPIPEFHHGVVETPDLDYPFYAWSIGFSREDILDVFEDGPINRLLLCFLTEHPADECYSPIARRDLRKSILSHLKIRSIKSLPKDERIKIESTRLCSTVTTVS